MRISKRAILTSIAAVFASVPAYPQRARILLIEGNITAKNYNKLEKILLENFDKIVGLKIYFSHAEDPAPLVATADRNQFVAYKPMPQTKSEIVASNGYHWLHGGYQFDGYFLVKSGGVHQGAVSIGLLHTDETRILLSNPTIRRIRI
jgi:hypothetical protein